MADNRPPQDPYGAPYPDNYNQPGQDFNQTYPSDPYAAGNPPAGDPYAQPANDPYAGGGQGYDPYAPGGQPDPYGADPNDPNFAYNPQDPYAGQNSFEEKKTGNKVFLIVIIIVIVVLVGVAAVLIYLNLQGDSGTTDEGNTSQVGDNGNGSTDDGGDDDEGEIVQIQPDISKTGGEGTPATLSRQSTDGRLTDEWRLRHFQVQPYVDSEGNCTNEDRCGEQADPDNDGVTNIEEHNFGTDPMNSDTDRDGVADGDELYVYFTDPNAKDSDGDTFDDFVELANCYDPTADTGGLKMVESDEGFLNLDTIESNVELNPLKYITESSFSQEGASSADIARGYIQERCTPTAPAEEEPADADQTTPPGDDSETPQTPIDETVTPTAAEEQRI